METFFHISCLILLLSIVIPCISADGGVIGVNYGRISNELPPPDKVVALLKTQKINRVKLYDTDSTVLKALSDSNITVVVSLPNEHLSAAAAGQAFTDAFIQNNISAHLPSTKISAIAVGNEVFVDPKGTTKYLVQAMNNVQASLVKYGLTSIKISSPIALSALQTSYPASTGSFQSNLTQSVIKPFLDILRRTGSYLMVNVYPFFAYTANSADISLDYALFKTNPGVVDPNSGLKYTSLLEAQLDAVYAAMSALGYNDIKIVIAETGWPSKGDSNEVGAGTANAAAYNGNLVKRALTGNGTPMKPNETLDVYLFALFNENQKPGPTSERNYGLFYPNEAKVYDVPLTIEAIRSSSSSSDAVNNGSKAQVPVAAAPAAAPASSSAAGQTWCVASQHAEEGKLQAALDYACGLGKAKCDQIQEGATCFQPNTVLAHASYAFNSYYQLNKRAAGTCDFGGAGYVVTQAPRYGSCEYPTGY